MTKRKVSVEIRLPVAMIDWIDEQVKVGILGESREQVIDHLMRHHLFMLEQARISVNGLEPPYALRS